MSNSLETLPVNFGKGNFLTPEQKLELLQRDYWLVKEGKKDTLSCPFCGSENPIGCEPVCCRLFYLALSAILDRQDRVDDLMVGMVASNLGKTGYVN